MGAHLVSEALARWTHVSDRAFRVLVRMALTALDNPSKGRPAAVYNGGRELLAMSLRSDKGTPQTRYRAVKRALAELSEAGAIQHLHSGWAGQNAVYRLTLGGARAVDGDPSEPERMGGPTSPPEGGQISPPMGGPSGTERGVSKTPPRNQEEPLDERGEEEVVDVETGSHPPRATAKPPPNRCPDHHIRLRPRTDDLAPCPLCRRGVPASAEHLAPVIDLRTREVS